MAIVRAWHCKKFVFKSIRIELIHAFIYQIQVGVVMSYSIQPSKNASMTYLGTYAENNNTISKKFLWVFMFLNVWSLMPDCGEAVI